MEIKPEWVEIVERAYEDALDPADLVEALAPLIAADALEEVAVKFDVQASFARDLAKRPIKNRSNIAEMQRIVDYLNSEAAAASTAAVIRAMIVKEKINGE